MRMLHLVVFLLSTTIDGTWGASLSSNSAALPQLDDRIVGGNVTTIDLFPWQVSLQTLHGDHVCGGAIINKEIILTAAHCLQSVTPDKIQIRVGSSYWSHGGMTFKAANLQNHPEFKAEVLMNDVALIRLMKPLTFGPTIQPIQLATESPANRAVAKISGWGTTSFGSETLPHQLISVDVNIISRDICGSSVYGYGERIKRTMICAAAAGKDSCQGDSGGPLVSDGLVVGIVSWGYGCALANYPGVYADVAELSYWIKETSEVLLKTNCIQNLR